MQSVSMNAITAPATINWTILAGDQMEMGIGVGAANMQVQLMVQNWYTGWEPGGRWWGRGIPPLGDEPFQSSFHALTEEGVPWPVNRFNPGPEYPVLQALNRLATR